MHPLTAAVPDSEVRRSEFVATRLARKVAPLFGVVWESNPFGCTWLCDFAALTLAEIGRGAPYPPREVQAALDAGPGHDGGPGAMTPWRWAGRAVWTPRRGPTPTAIAHATLNRYGPDTKAAVVLTGANRLLLDVTAAIAGVCRYLADLRVSPELRLAVWAGLVLEAYRGQPALVVAAIEARAVQRALATPWTGQISLGGSGDWARCEIGERAAAGSAAPGSGDAAGRSADPHRPVSLDLIDATLPLLDLPLHADDGRLISEAELLDDVAGWWCRRLVQIGSPGRGIAWVAEQGGLHRTLQTYVRAGSLVAPFVAEVFGAFAIGCGQERHLAKARLPVLPPRPDLDRLPLPAQRAHLLVAPTVASYVRFHDDVLRREPELRAAAQRSVQAACEAAACLGPADPVRLLLNGYAACCEVGDLCSARDPDPGQLGKAAAVLDARLDETAAAWHDGHLDPGTASDMLEAGAIALGRARAVLGSAGPAADPQAGRWRDVLLARGLDPAAALGDPAGLPAAQQFYLENYADFRAATAGTAAELRDAEALQRACLRVREQVAGRAGS